MTDSDYCSLCNRKTYGPTCMHCDVVGGSAADTWQGAKILLAIFVPVALLTVAAYLIWPELEYWNTWRRFFHLSPRP